MKVHPFSKTGPNTRGRSSSSGEEGGMLHFAEVAIEPGNLAHELSQMRTWLDHMKIQVIGFRQIPAANICRVEFEMNEARGRLPRRLRARYSTVLLRNLY